MADSPTYDDVCAAINAAEMAQTLLAHGVSDLAGGEPMRFGEVSRLVERHEAAQDALTALFGRQLGITIDPRQPGALKDILVARAAANTATAAFDVVRPMLVAAE